MPTLCVNTVLTRSPSPVSGKEHHLLGSSPVVVREGHVLMDPRVSSPGSHSEYQVFIRDAYRCRTVHLRNPSSAGWFVDGRAVNAKRPRVSRDLPANPLQEKVSKNSGHNKRRISPGRLTVEVSE